MNGLSGTNKLKITAFALCFFAVGIPFWIIPYSQVNLPNAFYGIGMAVVFVVAALLCATSKAGFRNALLITGLAFPAALMARVIVEGIIDPTRHNLWPLALIIAIVLGLAVSGAGASLGWLMARIWR